MFGFFKKKIRCGDCMYFNRMGHKCKHPEMDTVEVKSDTISKCKGRFYRKTDQFKMQSDI